MITDGKKIALSCCRKILALLRGIKSKHKEDFYCLNCFHSYVTKIKLKKHENIYENQNYCYVEMPTEDNKTLKYKHREKSVKVPFIIYADLECLLEKMSTCHNNPEKLSSTKKIKHKTSSLNTKLASNLQDNIAEISKLIYVN